MRTHPYAGAVRYFMAGFLLGLVIIFTGYFFGEESASQHPVLEISEYSRDFIILLFSPLYLGFIFGAIGMRKQKFIETQHSIHEKSLKEQMLANAADVHNKLLGKIVAQVNEGIVITDAKGKVQWINEGFTNTNGYSLSDIIGEELLVHLPGAMGNDPFLQSLKEIMAAGEGFTEELLTLHKDGNPVWLYISLKPIYDASGRVVNFISIQKDINSRKEKELAIQSLLNEVSNYRFALDQSALVVIVDSEGRVVHVNSKFCEINNLEEAQLIGRDYRSFSVSLRDAEIVKPIWHTIKNGGTWKGELENTNIVGKTYWADTTIVPLPGSHGSAGQFLVMQQDISERKKLESDLISSNRKLYQAMTLAKLGSWELDKNNNLTLSPELRQLFKLPRKAKVSLREIASSIPGADLRKIRKAMADCKTSPHQIEVEYRVVSGRTERFMVSNINPAFNEMGEFTGFFGTVQDVTADRISDIALKKSEEEKAGIINNTQTIICLHDMKGTLIDINPAAETASGYKKQEVKGMNLRLLIAPDFQNEFDNYLKNISNVEKAKGTLQIVTKSGIKRIWHYQNAVYSGEGGKKYVIASAIDVTESVKAQHEIERQEQFIRQIIDNSPNVIFMLNEQREIVLANRTFANFYPYSEAQVPSAASLSRGPEDMFLGDLDGLFGMKDEEVRQSEGSIMHHATNTQFRFSLINKCFTDKKGKKIILGFGMDVTKRFQIESDLIAANQLVEKSLKVKDQFISNMSHEIRTPLNAVIGFTDLLSDTALDARQNDFVDIVKTASSNLLGIINNILDLSKIESSNLVLESVPLKLKKGINDVFKIFEPKATTKGLKLITTYDESLPETLLGDQLRLNQILFNLVSNALKFTDTGKIEIICKATTGEDKTKQYVEFSIIDTGIGVPKDKQSQIFERFTQANTNTQRLYGGTGLGLNIAQSIVELYKGSITIDSEVGRGTEFRVILPFDTCPELNIQSETVKLSQPVAIAQQITGSIHILLAEDNLVNATLAKEVLTKRGFTLKHVQNGALAVERVQEEYFDLVLMDIQMPVMNGIDASIAIRNLKGPVSQIPIIAMTAHSLHGEMKNCFSNGMNGYVAKPFKAAELFDSILELVRKKEAV